MFRMKMMSQLNVESESTHCIVPTLAWVMWVFAAMTEVATRKEGGEIHGTDLSIYFFCQSSMIGAFIEWFLNPNHWRFVLHIELSIQSFHGYIIFSQVWQWQSSPIPSGNQTWQWKIPCLKIFSSMIFPLKPSIWRDFPLPPLITRGYTINIHKRFPNFSWLIYGQSVVNLWLICGNHG